MNRFLLSFLSPRGRIGISGFWWRQLVLCPLFFIGFYFYQICDNLAFNLSDAYDLDWQLCCFITNFLILSSGSCLTNFAGICAGGVLGAEKACHLRHTQPVDYFIIEHCELVMVLALVLLLLALWCSFALILRRLRDANGGLRYVPVCLPGLLGVLLWVIGLREMYAGAVALVLCLIAHGLYCRPSRESQRSGRAKALLLSFVSPRGRIGRAGFWWRQCALLPLVFAGAFACCLGELLLGQACVFSALDSRLLLPDLLMRLDSGTLPNLLGTAWGGVSAENVAASVLGDPKFSPMFTSREMIALGLAQLIPATWCSFALILRRLRDSRPGLWALPLCLPGLWLLGIKLLPLEGMLLSYLWYALLVLAHVVFLLPSRKGAPSAS